MPGTGKWWWKIQDRSVYRLSCKRWNFNIEYLRLKGEGIWTPSKAAVVITLYWYSTEKGKYVKMSEYTSLKTGGTYKFTVYETGLYKVYFKPSYPITGGTIIGSFN